MTVQVNHTPPIPATPTLAHDWTCRRCGMDRSLLMEKHASGGWMNLSEKLCWGSMCVPLAYPMDMETLRRNGGVA